MQVRVRFFGPARDATGEIDISVEVPSGGDVAHLLDTLAARYGDGFRRAVLRNDGTVWPEMAILVNGGNIMLGAGLATPLQVGDEVSIVPVITGG